MAKNKYNLGDRLWPIQNLNGRAFVARPFDCLVMKLDHNEITYSYTDAYGFYEVNVFASEADAAAECERRNAPRKVPVSA